MQRILKKLLWLLGLAGAGAGLYALMQKQGERVLAPVTPRSSPAAPPAASDRAAAGGSPSTTGSSSAATGRCAATTNSGSRCSRPADEGSRYCWQHAES